MSDRLKCKLFCSSASELLYQVYAGFAELQHSRLIDIELLRLPDYSSSIYSTPILLVEVSNQYLVAYDTMDQPWLHPTLDIKKMDYCFKKNYIPEHIENSTYRQKIFPLGLNYCVFSKHDFYLRRALWSNNFRDFFTQLIRSNRLLSKQLGVMNSIFTSELSGYEKIPKLHDNSKVLFMTRAWDPDHVKKPQFKEEREKINTMRADCIRKLRKEFRDQFTGGFEHNDFAIKKYSDCLLPDPRMSRKENYLGLMHDADICITTVGGQGSNSSKLGEYVAASKAIVTERSKSGEPGNFKVFKNYLEFETADKCVESTRMLFQDRKEIWKMMVNNWRYYHQYVHPKSMIWNSLMIVISNAKASG